MACVLPLNPVESGLAMSEVSRRVVFGGPHRFVNSCASGSSERQIQTACMERWYGTCVGWSRPAASRGVVLEPRSPPGKVWPVSLYNFVLPHRAASRAHVAYPGDGLGLTDHVWALGYLWLPVHTDPASASRWTNRLRVCDSSPLGPAPGKDTSTYSAEMLEEHEKRQSLCLSYLRGRYYSQDYRKKGRMFHI
jgi:hypothetical protein